MSNPMNKARQGTETIEHGLCRLSEKMVDVLGRIIIAIMFMKFAAQIVLGYAQIRYAATGSLYIPIPEERQSEDAKTNSPKFQNIEFSQGHPARTM